MAEEEAKEGGEQQAERAGEQPQQAGGSKLLPIIIVVVLLLGIAAGVAYYFLVWSSDHPSIEASSPEEAKFLELYQKRSQPSVEAVQGEGEPVISKPFSYKVNLSDKQHMLQLSFRAKLYDEDALSHLMKYKALIDNNLMEMLGQLKASDMRNRAGLELLKQAIYKELNSHFGDAFIESEENKSKDRTPVKDVLIAEFYIN